MRRSGVVPAGWGFLLAVYGTIEVLAFGAQIIEFGMLIGSGVVMMALGALSWAGEGRGIGPVPERDEPRPLPDLSVSSVVLALGLAMAAAGWELGPWLMYIGGGTVVVGVSGLIREFRAERRAVRSS